MARGEVKEAVGQGSSPMREALCLRLKVLCGKQCWQRARMLGLLLISPPILEEQNFPFWEGKSNSKCSSRVGFSLLQPLLPWQCTCVAVGRQ
jgi:hypothetical protein